MLVGLKTVNYILGWITLPLVIQLTLSAVIQPHRIGGDPHMIGSRVIGLDAPRPMRSYLVCNRSLVNL